MTTWNLANMQRHLLICNGATCMGAGAEEVTQQIRAEIKEQQLDEAIHTSRTRCNGRCRDKCVVIDYPKGTWYSVSNEETAKAIVHEQVNEADIIYSMTSEGRVRNDGRIKGIEKYRKRKKKGQAAVLFVGHGSRLEAGNIEVRQFVDSMLERIDASLLVETCFLEFATPSIEDGIQACIEKGAELIHVVPIILLSAGHSKLHIPAEIEEARGQFPDIRFTYGQTIGIHSEVLEILMTRLKEVGYDTDGEHDETVILFIGRGCSDDQAIADFYQIADMLKKRLNVCAVECAFMGVAEPTVVQGFANCLKHKPKQVVMLPYFLFTGILMERMAQMANNFSVQHPDIHVQLASYFGYHPKLQTILLERLQQNIDGTSTGMQDLENFRQYVAEHGYEHHHHH